MFSCKDIVFLGLLEKNLFFHVVLRKFIKNPRLNIVITIYAIFSFIFVSEVLYIAFPVIVFWFVVLSLVIFNSVFVFLISFTGFCRKCRFVVFFVVFFIMFVSCFGFIEIFMLVLISVFFLSSSIFILKL